MKTKIHCNHLSSFTKNVALLILFLSAYFSGARFSLAQLGYTADEAAQLGLGKPIKEYNKSWEQTVAFEKSGMEIELSFFPGGQNWDNWDKATVGQVSYSPKDKNMQFTEEQIRVFLDRNSNGSQWIEVSEPPFKDKEDDYVIRHSKIRRYFKRSDGGAFVDYHVYGKNGGAWFYIQSIAWLRCKNYYLSN